MHRPFTPSPSSPAQNRTRNIPRPPVRADISLRPIHLHERFFQILAHVQRHQTSVRPSYVPLHPVAIPPLDDLHLFHWPLPTPLPGGCTTSSSTPKVLSRPQWQYSSTSPAPLPPPASSMSYFSCGYVLWVHYPLVGTLSRELWVQTSWAGNYLCVAGCLAMASSPYPLKRPGGLPFR